MIRSTVTAVDNRKIHGGLSALDSTLKIRMTLKIDHINGRVMGSGQRSQSRSSPVLMLSLRYHHQSYSPKYRCIHNKP